MEARENERERATVPMTVAYSANTQTIYIYIRKK